jgi:hypothetical protein
MGGVAIEGRKVAACAAAFHCKIVKIILKIIDKTTPDDESSKEAGGPRPIAVAINCGVFKEFDNVRVHLAYYEDLHVEQLLQTIMGEIGGERAVTHAHV